MRWNLRMTAAERGIWTATELRRQLAEAGLVISAGKMSALWTGSPTMVRLDDLDIICLVLDCGPQDLLKPEPEKAASRRPTTALEARAVTSTSAAVTPRLGRRRTKPPV